MKDSKPLFLLGTGRSGTTLVQRFLNAHSDTIIWGEHIGFLESLADSYFLLKEHPSMHDFSFNSAAHSTDCDLKSYYKDPKRWQAWMNWFTPSNVDDFYRDFIKSVFSPSIIDGCDVWGFKEIRYGENTKVINFLKALYPNAVFLCVVRDSLNVIESQLTTFFQGTSKYPKLKRIMQLPTLVKIATKWVSMNSTYQKLAKNDDRFFLLKYEDFTTDYRKINPVLALLGLDIQSSQLAVFELAEGRGSSFDSASDVNDRWKKMGFIPAFVSEVITGAAGTSLGYPRPQALLLATFLSKLTTRRSQNKSHKK